MSKVRVVYRDDGGVSVIHPAPNSQREGETEIKWLERVFMKSMSDQDDLYGQDYDDIDKSEVPTDRKYRDAWTGSKGNGISIDAVKKAEIDARLVYTEEQEIQIRAKIREMAINELGF